VRGTFSADISPRKEIVCILPNDSIRYDRGIIM
jgi:hypothetical protein